MIRGHLRTLFSSYVLFKEKTISGKRKKFNIQCSIPNILVKFSFIKRHLSRERLAVVTIIIVIIIIIIIIIAKIITITVTVIGTSGVPVSTIKGVIALEILKF